MTKNILRLLKKYEECMKDPVNILKFFTSSASILNIKIAKTIHKDFCPLISPIFMDFKKIVYLIIKSNYKSSENQALFNYLSYILNYLSDSLILFTSLIEFIYPVLFQVNDEIRSIIMKIFIKD
jgi:hypothetical protein